MCKEKTTEHNKQLGIPRSRLTYFEEQLLPFGPHPSEAENAGLEVADGERTRVPGRCVMITRVSVSGGDVHGCVSE